MHLHGHIMKKHLSRTEKANVRHFLHKEKRFRGDLTVVEKATPLFMILLGFFFVSYTLTLFSGKPTDYVMKWVLMPGVLGGLVLVLSGVLCGILIRRRNEKSRLMGILRKRIS
jgi:hypothetical protein